MEKTTKVNVIVREADIIKGKPLDYKTFVKKKMLSQQQNKAGKEGMHFTLRLNWQLNLEGKRHP